MVPELTDPQIREVVQGSYRIVYRVTKEQVHVLTVHHAARMFPSGR
jgi:toxin ParE1/3/4